MIVIVITFKLDHFSIRNSSWIVLSQFAGLWWIAEYFIIFKCLSLFLLFTEQLSTIVFLFRMLLIINHLFFSSNLFLLLLNHFLCNSIFEYLLGFITVYLSIAFLFAPYFDRTDVFIALIFPVRYLVIITSFVFRASCLLIPTTDLIFCSIIIVNLFWISLLTTLIFPLSPFIIHLILDILVLIFLYLFCCFLVFLFLSSLIHFQLSFANHFNCVGNCFYLLIVIPFLLSLRCIYFLIILIVYSTLF